ncbi:MAG: manganese efflux pump [Butyricicoccus pullicaecorum]|nr:manganese efflux pump [Butyricicoccus pullicaecorum]
MQIWELFLVAVSLAMDAFAVSVCKGLSVLHVNPRQALSVGLYFGGFQALMPLLGYLVGIRFQNVIWQYDHWIAFFLLGFLGVSMLKEAYNGAPEDVDASFRMRAMLPLAIATSIDALTVGVTFAFLEVSIVPAVSLIGVVTGVLCLLGVHLGHQIGRHFQRYTTAAGGGVLIFLGTKILITHLYGG